MTEIDSTTEAPASTTGSGPRVRPATMDHLRKKRKRERVVPIQSLDDDDMPITLEMRLRAISSRAYDKLIGDHPPTPTQRDQGAAYNVDSFAPALIAAVSLEPKMSTDDATEIYNSDEWSPGEVGGLFLEALRLCNVGLDVPFTERG